MPPDRFAGPAVVADVRGLPARAPIAPALTAPALDALAATPGALLLLVTGWSAHRGTDAYLAHPWPRRRPGPWSRRARARWPSTR
ncbi:cyclase family protein [Streptomyces sp. NPDC001450]